MLSAGYMYFGFLLVGIGVIWMYLDRSPGIWRCEINKMTIEEFNSKLNS
jgi:hypothetical protein